MHDSFSPSAAWPHVIADSAGEEAVASQKKCDWISPRPQPTATALERGDRECLCERSVVLVLVTWCWCFFSSFVNVRV